MKLFPTKLNKFKKAMSNAKTIDNVIEDFINYYNNYFIYIQSKSTINQQHITYYIQNKPFFLVT